MSDDDFPPAWRECVARAMQRSNRPKYDSRNQEQRDADEDASWAGYCALALAALRALRDAGALLPEGWVSCGNCMHWSEDEEGGSCVLRLNDPARYRQFRTSKTCGCTDGQALVAAPKPGGTR